MALRSLLPALLAVLPAGCASPPPPLASQYHVVQPVPSVLLAFAPGRDEPQPADAASLRVLSAALPVQVVPEFYAAGPRTLPRALSVRRITGRPVIVRPPSLQPGAPSGPDIAVLAFPTQPGIVADSCLGPGQPGIGGFMPWDDSRQARFLPPGCSVAAAMQAQVVAGTGGSDLLQGRPLLPGASLPFADAVESYYRRNDPSRRSSPAASSASDGAAGPSDSAPSSSVPASAGPAVQTGPAPVNPLLGPLPGAPAR